MGRLHPRKVEVEMSPEKSETKRAPKRNNLRSSSRLSKSNVEKRKLHDIHDEPTHVLILSDEDDEFNSGSKPEPDTPKRRMSARNKGKKTKVEEEQPEPEKDDQGPEATAAEFLKGLGLETSPPRDNKTKTETIENGQEKDTSLCHMDTTHSLEDKNDKDEKVSQSECETPLPEINVKPSDDIDGGKVVTTDDKSSTEDLCQSQNAEMSNPTTIEEKVTAEAETPSSNPVGKLRSSAADFEGQILASNYKQCIRETTEYARKYICEEYHHPVISCFRELTKTDVATIVGSSKLKKSFDTLEQSILYIGLLDFLATTNSNPLYGSNCNAKLTKKIPSLVQKILLEFKSIIGTWALSGNEFLNNRYALIIRYLRPLVPMFRKIGFDEQFQGILDCIESEVARHRSNQEKIKAMGNGEVERKQQSDFPLVEELSRSALNEIILNVSLNVKDDSDDDDVVVVPKESKIFGKPLKTTTENVKNKKKQSQPRALSGPGKTGPSRLNQNSNLANSSKPVSSSQLKSTPVSTNCPSTSSNSENVIERSKGNGQVKRNAVDDLKKDNEESAKKLKLDRPNSASTLNHEKSDIRSFFQSPPNTNSLPISPRPTNEKPKAVNAFAIMMDRSREIGQQKKEKLNAFAIMMNRSREIAQQKKEKLNAPPVAVKT